jgi:DNA-binding MarR family transcriptional regulator
MSVELMGTAWDVPLPATTKLVLMAFLYAADECGHCSVTRKWIAEKCGVALGTVDRHIAQLVNINWLTKELQFDDNGSNIKNFYQVRMPF